MEEKNLYMEVAISVQECDGWKKIMEVALSVLECDGLKKYRGYSFCAGM